MDSSGDFTDLLARAREGDADAANRAMAVLYTELHGIAAAYMRRERPGHTLRPTALVHEAYLRLPSSLSSVKDRHHFFALAAQAMRRVLVDHARQKRSDKRGGNPVRVTLSAVPGVEELDVDLLALDEALSSLAAIDERAARVVELRFFCGHTDKEVSEMLGLSLASVRRDWEYTQGMAADPAGRVTPADMDHHALVRALFDAAVVMPPDERVRFVEAQTPDQESVRAEVLSLLRASDDSQFLAAPLRAPLAEDPVAGLQVGRYRLLREIGRGGMGVVYLAVRNDDVFHKTVALKIISASNDREFTERFKKERQILAGIDHPNIARILDGGDTDDGRPFYVMEHVVGVSIDEYCRRVDAPADQRIRLMLQTGEAVAYLHEQAIVHRDLKPSNILVTGEGQVKLLDFGIAKVHTVDGLLGADVSSGRRTLLLTPGYASPEQLQGNAVSKRSDVYSLGVVLYEILTGRLPFAYEDGRPDLGKQLSGAAPVAPSLVTATDPDARRTSSTTRRLAADLDVVVLTALRSDPSRRYADVRLLVEDLTCVLDGRPLRVKSGSWPYVLGHFLGRHRAIASLAALLVVALSVAGGFAIQSRVDRARVETAEAEMERLVRVLNVRVERWASPDAVSPTDKAADVEGARRILQSKMLGDSMASGDPSGRGRVVVGGIRRFLDRADQLSTDQPELRKSLALTYRQVGDVVALAPAASGPGARREAVASYRRAATIAASVLPVDGTWVKTQLAELSTRMNRFGASLDIAVTALDPRRPSERPVVAPRPQADARVSSVAPVRAGEERAPGPPGQTPPSPRLARAVQQVEDTRHTVDALRSRLSSQGHVVRPEIDLAMAQAEKMLEEARTADATGDTGSLEDALRRLTYTLQRLHETVGR